MKVLILGVDGYIGWALALNLLNNDYEVYGIDDLSRRRRVWEVPSDSATPILPLTDRIKASGFKMPHEFFNVATEPNRLDTFIEQVQPDAVVHLAEIPSAPYSMASREQCNLTFTNNVIGTNNLLYALKKHAPDCHLVKMGTLGEYGCPNIDIPEGFFEINYHGRQDRLPFPRRAGSFYHLSKVHDSGNIDFACRVWGLRSTDIMQGVVHGVKTPEMTSDALLTRFDFDEIWGTALNRFCAQAVTGEKLTPYGAGNQSRGFIALRDSVQCLKLIIDNPPRMGEYRVLNQFEETYSINELAETVQDVGYEFGLRAEIEAIENPRVEVEEHYYNPEHRLLPSMGFKPTYTLRDELRVTIPLLMEFRHRIAKFREAFAPRVKWR